MSNLTNKTNNNMSNKSQNKTKKQKQKQSKKNKQDPQKVYIMKEGKNDNYKIGISANPEKRRGQLQTGSSHEIKILFKCKIDPGIRAKSVETIIHDFLKENGKWIRGEWFYLTRESVFLIAKNLMIVGDNMNKKE